MELIVLGCDGPYPAPDGATAGYLVQTGIYAGMGTSKKAEETNEERENSLRTVALDMGSGVFSRLQRYCKPEDVSAVVLSHLHHDHISDMGVFNYYLELMTKRGVFQGRIPCYVPPVEEEITRLQKRYPYFRFVGVKEGATYQIGGMQAEFCKLLHASPDYGVRLTSPRGDRRLVYTGDTNVCANLDRLLLSCDLWLGSAPCIGGDYDEAGGHLSVEIMQGFAVKHGVRAIVSHLCPVHTVKEYENACTQDCVQIAVPFKRYEV